MVKRREVFARLAYQQPSDLLFPVKNHQSLARKNT